MFTWSAALRVLLSLALVLNGAGAAMAATQMQLGQGIASHSHAPASSGQSDMPCHTGHAGHAMTHADHTMPGQPSEAVPDCCQGGICSCACMSVAQAMLPGFALPAPLWVQPQGAKPLQPGHPNPALTHLIRPPIG